MIRSYKVFGLAVLAMLAFGAFMAQGASAVPLTCEGVASGATCFSTGNQESTFVLSTSGGTVSCTEVIYRDEGTAGAGGAVNEMTVIPSYPTEKSGGGNNCTAFGFAGTHIKVNECDFTFTTPTAIKSGEVTWGKEQIHLLCPAGKQMEITPTTFGVSACTQFIAPQTVTSGHVVGRNVAGSVPMDVTLESTLEGIHYTGTGGACGNGETHIDGKLTGNSTVRCYSDKEHKKQIGCTFS